MKILVQLKKLNNSLLKMVSVILKFGNRTQTVYSKIGDDDAELLDSATTYVKNNTFVD
jgi:hypothetical protein